MAIKILTFSSLYPNSANPEFGIFVENRLRELLKTTDTDAAVVAPGTYFLILPTQKNRNLEREEASWNKSSPPQIFKYPQNRYEHCATIDGSIRITSYSQVKKKRLSI